MAIKYSFSINPLVKPLLVGAIYFLINSAKGKKGLWISNIVINPENL